jgi:hypothetical protein
MSFPGRAREGAAAARNFDLRRRVYGACGAGKEGVRLDLGSLNAYAWSPVRAGPARDEPRGVCIQQPFTIPNQSFGSQPILTNP